MEYCKLTITDDGDLFVIPLASLVLMKEVWRVDSLAIVVWSQRELTLPTLSHGLLKYFAMVKKGN